MIPWTRLRHAWQRLTEPSPRIEVEAERQQVRLLATLLIALLLAILVIFPIWVLANVDFLATRPISASVIAALSAAYLLSRTRYYRLGTYLLIATLVALVAAVLLTAPGPITERMLSLNFLVVVIVVTSLLLSIRATLIASGLSFLAIAAFFAAPAVPFAVTYSYLVFLGVTSALIIVSSLLRNQFARRLSASEAYQRAVIQNAPYGIHRYQLDAAGRLVLTGANPAAERILGVDHNPLIGQQVEQAFPGLVRTELPTMYRQIAQHGEAYFRDEVAYNNGGITGTFEVVAFQSLPGHVAVFFADVTAVKEAARQSFAVAVEQARVHFLAEFVRNTSHEFKTPLAVIQTATFLLRKQVGEAPERTGQIDTIEGQANYINALVEAMMTLTRLDVATNLTIEPLNINQMMLSLHDAFLPACQEKGITLELHLAEALAVINGGLKEFQQALTCLIDNALAYTPPGGTITLETAQSADSICVTVRDTGIGISAEHLPHIFERFYRADEARSTRHAGLGLSIAQKIVTLQGGRIEVESAPGGGSTFRVLLPKANVPLAQSNSGVLQSKE